MKNEGKKTTKNEERKYIGNRRKPKEIKYKREVEKAFYLAVKISEGRSRLGRKATPPAYTRVDNKAVYGFVLAARAEVYKCGSVMSAKLFLPGNFSLCLGVHFCAFFVPSQPILLLWFILLLFPAKHSRFSHNVTIYYLPL